MKATVIFSVNECQHCHFGPVRQVRRMTGALVAVGQGRLSVLQLKEILDARDSLAFPQGLAAPAHGLFLTRVYYRESGEDAELKQLRLNQIQQNYNSDT